MAHYIELCDFWMEEHKEYATISFVSRSTIEYRLDFLWFLLRLLLDFVRALPFFLQRNFNKVFCVSVFTLHYDYMSSVEAGQVVGKLSSPVISSASEKYS